MKTAAYIQTLGLVATLLLTGGCGNEDQAISKPLILMDSEESFPKNCAVVLRGESIEFNAVFKDEQELGSYNLEIHNNFDHHSHSTEGESCTLDKKKAPVKPFIYNKDFSIPAGQTTYNAKVKIEVPADIDTGDYHFTIRLTNRAAWQEIKGISIKIRD